MDNKSTTKRMIGAVVLVLIAALLLAWLLKGKNKSMDQQELIAEQTQEAAPILGFPGVNKEGENAQVADATQEATQEYAIGSAEDPNAQQAAQGVLDQAATQTADAGKGVGATVAGAVGGAVTAGKEVVLDLNAKMEQNNTTGFDVRDSNGEVRQVVADGKAEAGVGSMGANEVSTDGKGKVADQTVAATTTTDAKATQATTSNKDTQQSVNVAAGDLNQGKVANPKLVNEKPVPPPATQRSASSSTNSSSGSQSVSASSSSSSRSSASSAQDATVGAAGRSGYVIQVLATSSKGKADGVRQSIAVDGYPAFVAQAKVDGKMVYRVRVGTYPGKGDASSVQNKMKARYAQNQYVQNSFVTEN